MFNASLNVGWSDVDDRATDGTGAVERQVRIAQFVEYRHFLFLCDRTLINEVRGGSVQDFAA